MTNFAEVAKAIFNIQNKSSTIEKQMILVKCASMPGFKDVLKFIYDPYNKTGISDAKMSKVNLLDRCGSTYIEYEDAMAYFGNHKTGTNADVSYAAMFVKYSKATYGEEAAKLALAIVTQKLKIGVSTTTLNKVYGEDFIPKIGCMLGTNYGEVGPIKTKWPCIVTEKLDGIRRILVKTNDSIRMYSRSGHEDTGCVEILEEAKYLPSNRVYDGELLAIGNFKDSIELRQATNSIGASKGTKRGLTFNVFDMIPLEEFKKGTSEDIAAVRKALLGATLMDDSIQHIIEDAWPKYIAAYGIHKELKFIKPVPILGVAKNIEQIEPIVEGIWNAGGEGVMLNSVDGLYEIKRSKQLLKVKLTKTYKLQVVGMQEGSGKFEDMLGALVVDYKGQRLGVGSGFSDSMRKALWADPDAVIDKWIEVDSFGESKNIAGGISLNCPIFKRFVGVEE